VDTVVAGLVVSLPVAPLLVVPLAGIPVGSPLVTPGGEVKVDSSATDAVIVSLLVAPSVSTSIGDPQPMVGSVAPKPIVAAKTTLLDTMLLRRSTLPTREIVLGGKRYVNRFRRAQRSTT
jgi:hypothetical protein